MWCERNDFTTNKLRISLSIADYDKFVFSWAARDIYGLVIATKRSKPHSHQSLLPGAQPGGGDRRCPAPKFQTANNEHTGCRFLNLCWFKNTNQSWMQTSRRCLYAFLTCSRASRFTHDVTRHHHWRVSSWVMWLRMLRATTSLPKQPFAFFIFYSAFLLNDQ